jgi:hypothetical protein
VSGLDARDALEGGLAGLVGDDQHRARRNAPRLPCDVVDDLGEPVRPPLRFAGVEVGLRTQTALAEAADDEPQRHVRCRGLDHVHVEAG